MTRLLDNPLAWPLALFAAMLMLIAFGVFIVGRLRGRAEKDQPSASEMMTKVKDLHSRGDLSEEEYRTIKTVLATQLQNELNDTGEKG